MTRPETLAVLQEFELAVRDCAVATLGTGPGPRALLRSRADWAVYADALHAAQVALQAQTWQPIASAPKDNWLLGWEIRSGIGLIGWTGGEFQWQTQLMRIKLTGSWEGYSPTHWQPLPAPPDGQETP